MESNQQQILSLIHKMRTDQVKEAEQKLMQLASSPHFMDTIFNIIKSNNVDAWVKTISSSFLNRVICEKLEQLGYKNMFQAISNIMSSYEIVASDKRCFQRSLVSLIQFIKQPQQINDWRNFILKHLNDPNLFDTGLLLIACTAIAEIQIDYLCIIINQTFQLTLHSTKVSVQNAMVVNELIKNWIVVFDKLTSVNDQQTVDQVMRKIASSKTLAKLIFSVYELSSPSQIWLCVNPQLYQLNLLKYQAAQLNRRVSQYALKNRISQNKCHCLQIITQSYNTIKNTIAVVGANLQIIQNYQCQDFVTSLFGLLVCYVKALEEPQVQQMNVLLHIVCFPFMKTRDQELYIFQQSPIEFNSLAQDLCDKQTFGILKTQAAKLLQTISDYCRQAMEKGIIFCVQCIKMKMGYIQAIQGSEIRILDIQTAFQILAIYSFSLQNYPAQLQALKIVVCDKRIMESPPLQLSKVFLFLAYNYSEIFRNPIDGNVWIQYALSYKKHPTTRYMALDFISNISDEFFTQSFFKEFIKLIVEGQQRQSGQVWSIILKIFDTQKQKINQTLCLDLVNSIFTRVQRQIVMLQSKNKESTIDLINALHVLRKIIEQREYIENKQQLKQRIFNITIIFNKAVQFDIEDQIIKIINQFIKIDGVMIRKDIYHLLPDILNQFKKEQYHEKSYFTLLNEIILKSKYHQIKPVIKALLSGLMFHLFDMSQTAKKQKMKVSIANILTILQNLLSIHGYQMSGAQDDCLCEIGAMCIRLFPSQQGQKIFSKALLAKALNLMFICHLYSKTQNTVQYLIKYAKQNIFHKYDAYVLVKLLSKAVFNEDNIHIVIEYLNLMIQITNQDERKSLGFKSAKGKMKIKRQEELNKILQTITSPFIDFQLKRSDYKFPTKREVTDCLTKMKSNNIDTYKLIVMNMNQEQRTKLTQILNRTTQVQGKSRVIRRVIGVKSKQEQQPKPKDDNSEFQENQEESQSNNFKRQRVLKKKTQTKKQRNDKISIQ